MSDRILLGGVVGSQAYGLAHEGSDVDRLGVYAAPTEQFLGLYPPTDKNSTKHSTKPDITRHEALKFCRLALGMNPTVYELLWLENYEYKTEKGAWLIELREAFQSRQAVRDAYFGYATQQFRKLDKHGYTPRGAKNARHLLRLLIQGYELYTTGKLTVRLEDPERVRDFGMHVTVPGSNLASMTIDYYEDLFDSADSPLPEKPDTDTVNDWLLTVRREMQ